MSLFKCINLKELINTIIMRVIFWKAPGENQRLDEKQRNEENKDFSVMSRKIR